MATIIARSAEAVHWYGKDGSPRYTVKAKDGSDRPTTLRDARKHGYLPSVTTILKIAAKPGLEAWKLNQMMMAALTLPRADGENEESFIKRVQVDSREQARKKTAHVRLPGHAARRVERELHEEPQHEDHRGRHVHHEDHEHGPPGEDACAREQHEVRAHHPGDRAGCADDRNGGRRIGEHLHRGRGDAGRQVEEREADGAEPFLDVAGPLLSRCRSIAQPATGEPRNRPPRRRRRRRSCSWCHRRQRASWLRWPPR